jgi:hypothetical protein
MKARAMNKEAGRACPACISNTKQPEIVAGHARAATMNVAGAGWALRVERQALSVVCVRTLNA